MGDDYTAKNLDVLMEAHRGAQERRDKGRSPWDRRIDVQSIINRDIRNESLEHCVKVAHEIGALLKARLPARFLDCAHNDYDPSLEELVQRFEEMCAEDFKDQTHTTPVEDLNYMLRDLYDWADVNRVWLGSETRNNAEPDIEDASRGMTP